MGWTSPRTWSPGELVTALMMNQHVRDNFNFLVTLESGTNAVVYPSLTRIAFGGSTSDNAKVWIRGAMTGGTDAYGLLVSPDLTVPVSGIGYVTAIAGGLVEAGSGTHPLLCGLFVSHPTVTGGGALVDNAATLYVVNEPAATVTGHNYAFWVATGRSRFGGNVFIGNQAANPYMTVGLTIQQSGADDEVLCFKSSDIAHSFTAHTGSDSFAHFAKATAVDGGLRIVGFTEDVIGLQLNGFTVNSDTSKNGASLGAVIVEARDATAATATTMPANANMFVVQNAGDTKFIVDADGDIHMDATSNINAWDDHDDVALLETFREVTATPNFRHRLEKNVDDMRHVLEVTGILSRGGFVSLKGLHGLQIDALRQVNYKLNKVLGALLREGVIHPHHLLEA